jgi:hypothetical protein
MRRLPVATCMSWLSSRSTRNIDVAECLVEIRCEDLCHWLSASVVATIERGPVIRCVLTTDA